jgi:hypothetical protein
MNAGDGLKRFSLFVTDYRRIFILNRPVFWNQIQKVWVSDGYPEPAISISAGDGLEVFSLFVSRFYKISILSGPLDSNPENMDPR